MFLGTIPEASIRSEVEREGRSGAGLGMIGRDVGACDRDYETFARGTRPGWLVRGTANWQEWLEIPPVVGVTGRRFHLAWR